MKEKHHAVRRDALQANQCLLKQKGEKLKNGKKN
jgi:hypothetical protein